MHLMRKHAWLRSATTKHRRPGHPRQSQASCMWRAPRHMIARSTPAREAVYSTLAPYRRRTHGFAKEAHECQFATSHTSTHHLTGETVGVWKCHGTGTQGVRLRSWPQYLYLPWQSKSSHSGPADRAYPPPKKGRPDSPQQKLTCRSHMQHSSPPWHTETWEK